MRIQKKTALLIAISILIITIITGCSNKKSSSIIDPDKILSNEHSRKAILMAIDKDTFVNTILNNGSIPVNYYVPRYLAIDSNGLDYRDFAGNMGYEYNLEKANTEWEEAKKELCFDEVTLKIILTDTDFNRKLGEYLKSELEQLEGLKIELRQMPMKQRMEVLTKGEYHIAFSGWSPDYPDPLAYLANFAQGQSYSLDTNYNNKEYNDLLNQGKNAKTTDESWKIFKETEKILLNDGYVVPMYQRASAYLQKDYVKDIVVSTYGTKYHYKWASVDKKEHVLRMTSSSDITTLDTCKLVDSLSGEIATNVFEGLTRMHENQEE